jgi:hypothetical protein
MKRKSNKRFVYYQFVLLALFLTLTMLNEVADLPHHLLGDARTTPMQRRGEMAVEIIIAGLVFSFELALIGKLRSDMVTLEGFIPIIPICASCKKIRTMRHWESVEEYINSHPLADLAHSFCPECFARSIQSLQEQGEKDVSGVATSS